MTTEERIAQIAQRFSQGLAPIQQALQNQQAQDNNQTSQLMQLEAQRRQQAIQAQEIEANLSTQTGTNYIGSGVGEKMLKGEKFDPSLYSGLGLTKKEEKDQAALKRQQSQDELDALYKQSMINKNNAAATKSGKSSIAEQSIDRNFAKTYDDFIVGGGYTKVDRGLNALKNVSRKLGEKGSDLTGPITGRMPDFVQSFTNPKAIEARDEVGTIIQDNLRAILGPAYTEKEGERVITRAYDPRLSEAANKKKLDALINQMESAARAKLEAAKYFERNGSLAGYKGSVVNSVDDIFKESATNTSANNVNPQHVQAIKSMSDEDLLKFVQGG